MEEKNWKELLKLLQSIDEKLDKIVSIAESYPYAPAIDWLEDYDVSYN